MQGLPRFGALLLALAATNSHGGDTLSDIIYIVSQHVEENEEIKQGLSFARLLSQLPNRYKKGQLRLALMRGIFSSSHNSIGRKRSLRILDELKRDPNISGYSRSSTKK